MATHILVMTHFRGERTLVNTSNWLLEMHMMLGVWPQTADGRPIQDASAVETNLISSIQLETNLDKLMLTNDAGDDISAAIENEELGIGSESVCLPLFDFSYSDRFEVRWHTKLCGGSISFGAMLFPEQCFMEVLQDNSVGKILQ